MLNVSFARGLSERLRGKPLIINAVNLSFCIAKELHSLRLNRLRAWPMWLMELVLARMSEQGSRQLIWACIGGKDRPIARNLHFFNADPGA